MHTIDFDAGKLFAKSAETLAEIQINLTSFKFISIVSVLVLLSVARAGNFRAKEL